MPESIDGRVELPVLDDEDVVAGTLGDLALVVEHQGFEAAGIGPLDLGQDVVQVVERLDPRVDGVGVIARRCRRDDLQAMLVKLRGVEADLVGDDDDLRIGRLPGVEAQAAGAPGDDDADVGIRELVGGQRVDDGVGHLLAGHGDLEMDGLGRFIQPVDMLLEPEDAARVGADALEDAVAVEQTVVEDADLGVGLRRRACR